MQHLTSLLDLSNHLPDGSLLQRVLALTDKGTFYPWRTDRVSAKTALKRHLSSPLPNRSWSLCMNTALEPSLGQDPLPLRRCAEPNRTEKTRSHSEQYLCSEALPRPPAGHLEQRHQQQLSSVEVFSDSSATVARIRCMLELHTNSHQGVHSVTSSSSSPSPFKVALERSGRPVVCAQVAQLAHVLPPPSNLRGLQVEAQQIQVGSLSAGLEFCAEGLLDSMEQISLATTVEERGTDQTEECGTRAGIAEVERRIDFAGPGTYETCLLEPATVGSAGVSPRSGEVSLILQEVTLSSSQGQQLANSDGDVNAYLTTHQRLAVGASHPPHMSSTHHAVVVTTPQRRTEEDCSLPAAFGGQTLPPAIANEAGDREATQMVTRQDAGLVPCSLTVSSPSRTFPGEVGLTRETSTWEQQPSLNSRGIQSCTSSGPRNLRPEDLETSVPQTSLRPVTPQQHRSVCVETSTQGLEPASTLEPPPSSTCAHHSLPYIEHQLYDPRPQPSSPDRSTSTRRPCIQQVLPSLGLVGEGPAQSRAEFSTRQERPLPYIQQQQLGLQVLHPSSPYAHERGEQASPGDQQHCNRILDPSHHENNGFTSRHSACHDETQQQLGQQRVHEQRAPHRQRQSQMPQQDTSDVELARAEIIQPASAPTYMSGEFAAVGVRSFAFNLK